MKIFMATMGLGIGGAETHIVELAKELKARGHEVVIASNGYPENVIKGARVPEIEVDEDSHVYYAGVASDEHGNLVANSGRVLLVETSAPDIKSAQDKVYAIIDKLELRGLFYRHDIGFKALK